MEIPKQINTKKQIDKDDNTYKDLLIISDYVVTRVIKRDFKDEECNIIKNKFGYLKEGIYANIRRKNLDLDDLGGLNDEDIERQAKKTTLY